MKKLLIALSTLAAFTGSAMAADMAPQTYRAPPPMVPVYSWTGFYIFGGVGGGLWNANTFTRVTPGGAALSINQNQGGNGWYGTVGAGYDWQVSPTWVFGILADGQFGSLKGTIQDPVAAWS